jgi:hypothetical protein
MTEKYEVAAYYFPNYHQDERNDTWHGEGWNEWELVKEAKPRFEGHAQPKVPLWGYEDESNPEVMEKKINAAEQNGVDAFIFDWYWHNEGPFLMKALDEGFLKARNNDKLKFSIMWANHDWVEIQPATRCKPYNTRANGSVSEKTFIEATDHIINTYFSHPSYWRVDGGLYFSIYELMSLVKGFGSIENTKRILCEFRDRVRKQGLGEIHLNAVIWGVQILPGEEKITNGNELLDKLGFDSVTSYVWIHHNEMTNFPFTSYAKFRDLSIKEFQKLTDEYKLPYIPNVTMGWDPSPRTIQSDRYDNLGYPFTPILEGNTPDEFKKALEQAKEFLNMDFIKHKILTINAWNEWTEGSYLEPDNINGFKYLEAIKTVFSKEDK